MNKEWSDCNREMQSLLKKDTLPQAIDTLIALRDTLMQQVLSWRSLSAGDFCAMPYPNADGYHSKTVAYSLWHIFRIEDIVVQSLIRQEEEIIFSGSYAQKMHAPILTTGNELKGTEIADFSRQLDVDVLYQYIGAVKASTDAWLRTLDYNALKTTFSPSDKARLEELGVVSTDESAGWLIDYWCGKDIKGLIKMPLSRHWIMHIEAALRIIHKIRR